MSSYGTFPSVATRYNGKGYYGNSQVNSGLVYPKPLDDFAFRSTITRSRSGSSLPNWKRIISSGGNATTGFSATRSSYQSAPAQLTWKGDLKGPPPAGWKVCEWIYYSHGIGPITSVQNPHNILEVATRTAQVSFYKKLDSVMTTFQGGTALAELTETLQMIKNPAKALREGVSDYLNAVKKLRPRTEKSKRKLLGGTWLEYSFGWVPLLSDLDDAAKAYSRIKDGVRSERVVVSGFGSAESFSTDSWELGSWYKASGKSRTISSATCRYKGAVSSTISPSRSIDMMSTVGLHPRNFVPTLWEVIPWSFLIDYFTNVGDVLTAWTLGNTRLTYGVQTVRRRTFSESHETTYKGPSLYPNREVEWLHWHPGYTSALASSVVRSPITYVPVPDFSFEIPKPGIKWLNMAALVASRKTVKLT